MSNTQTDRETSNLLTALLILAAVAVIAVGATYYISFGGKPLADHERWGQFGDYFGGTLNPILGFLTFVAIIMTLAVQSRQLEFSRQQLQLSKIELEATREELRRTADAQAKSAESLNAQLFYLATAAKISAVAAGLKAADDELARIKESGFMGGQFDRERHALLDRRARLAHELDQLSNSIK